MRKFYKKNAKFSRNFCLFFREISHSFCKNGNYANKTKISQKSTEFLNQLQNFSDTNIFFSLNCANF